MGKLVGVVLRSAHAPEVVKFYERLLGTNAVVHAHGGPQHIEIGLFEPASVLELYTKSEQYQEDAIMIEVEDLNRSLATVVEYGGTVVVVKQALAYVRDPDDRLLLLVVKP